MYPRKRTHFMLLAGVIWPNMLASSKIAVYAVSESSLLSVAVPKYSLPFALASEFNSPVCAGGGVLLTVLVGGGTLVGGATVVGVVVGADVGDDATDCDTY